MSKTHRLLSFFACLVICAGFSTAARASGTLTRAFLNTKGSDSNPCTQQSPCRNIAAGLAALANDGELVIEDTGTFNATAPATITQSVIIDGTAVHANAAAASGGSAINVNAPGATVVIRGIAFTGGTTGTTGVSVSSVGTLRLTSCTFNSFQSDAVDIDLSTSGGAIIEDSNVTNCGNDGVLATAAGGSVNVYIHDTYIAKCNNAGVEAAAGAAITAARGASNFSGTGLLADSGGTLAIDSTNSIGNTTGIEGTGTGTTVTFARCLVTFNSTGVLGAGGAVVSGSNPGTSLVTNNSVNSSGLSSPSPLL